MAVRIRATDAALAAIARLTATHGPLMFFQSGGCCDGSSPICLLGNELETGPNDLLLGEVAGAPFYIDAEQDRRFGSPQFVLDVGAGPPEGLSLGLDDIHFVTTSGTCAATRS